MGITLPSDGMNPRRGRGPLPKLNKGNNFFFISFLLVISLDLIWYCYLAERSLNHAGSQHYLRIQHATTPKFVSLEYPRADGTILIAELSWTTESWVPIRIRTEIFHARLKLGSKLTAPKNWSNEEKKFFFQKICRNHHGTVFVRRAKTWVGFEQDFWNFFFLVACRALNFWTWRNNF